MSEFGLQSWPAAITMAKTIKDPQQWTWDSPLMQSRNHHPDGQMQILQQISMHFHVPAGPAPWKPHTDGQQLKYWRQMLWMTQVNQAVGYKVEVEHFRRIRSECSATLPGCNMGRMYWQTNDIWPGTRQCHFCQVENLSDHHPQAPRGQPSISLAATRWYSTSQRSFTLRSS